MDVTSVIGIIAVIILLLIIVLLIISDSDLTLLYHETFHPPTEQHFKDKVIWITGASSGIGECLAYDLASFGAKLILSGVSVQKLEAVKKNCLEKYGLKEDEVLSLPFSIENFSLHEECVQKVVSKFGRIDILVNNAGVSQRGEFNSIDIEVDQKLFSINVFGMVNLTRKVLPHMLENKGGHIVVTSSTAGKMGAPFSSPYTGSKHALHGYFECLRTEFIHKNISVTLACPGPIFSGLLSRLLTDKVDKLLDESSSRYDKRMKTSRCSYLMAVAMANKLDECWICHQPLLTIYYLTQYTPSFFKNVLLKVFFNEEKVKAFRSGKK